MAQYLRAQWDAQRLRHSAFFKPIRPYLLPLLDYREWPDLAAYQAYLAQAEPAVETASGKPLRIVAQAGKPERFEQRYAPRIYLTGEMQTRLENWHDFFQVITWRVFPRSKAVINARHFQAVQQRFARDHQQETGRRCAEENLLSLFDECGAVVVSDRPSLLALIKNFDWKTLFYQRREELSHMQCVLFGHALYEKTFNPYIGLTANALLLEVGSDFFRQTAEQRLSRLDKQIAELFDNQQQRSPLQTPKDLHPLPLLGFPGYWPGNEAEAFYRQTHYFRPGRGTVAR